MTRSLSLVLLAALTVAPALAQPDKAPERFQGNMVSLDNAGRRSTAFVVLQVDHWGTEQEAVDYLKILKEKGQNGLLETFYDAKEVGYIKVGDRLGYHIVFAREIPTPDGRIVRAWTDRPIMFAEAMRNTRSRDYPFGVLEIKFVGDGKGEGTLTAAVQMGFDDKGQLAMERWDTQPYKVMNVKAEPVKEKKKD